ncbi:MAG: sodium-dependent transporter [Wenzhouxiangellaceae bacterium]|nr:sodium-dependent transporter [Wenzhouxiangellaceae bacterium]
MARPQQQEEWTSRMAIIIAAVSMAVGTGNIWRFPRVAAEWGGGAFLIAVTVALLIWAVPLLMCEFLMGSRARLGNIGAFRDFMGRKYTWAGGFMVAVTLGIMFYYSVVAGWCIRYFVVAATGGLVPDREIAGGATFGQQNWEAFIANPVETIGYHAVAVIFTTAVVYQGIKGGLERVLKVFLVALLVILVVLAARAVMLPGSAAGLRFLFVPEWSLLLEARVWLEAFTQVAWSTGAGWGLLMIYAVYARQNEDIAVNSGIIAFSDVLVGFFAAALVLGTLFAVAPTPEFAEEALSSGNYGLTFIYIVDLIATMPGAWIISPLFFLALALAGVSSFIAMFELGTTNLMNFGFHRRNAAIAVGIVAFLFGIPSALSIDFLGNQDWVWGVGLLISGLLTALAILKYGVNRARAEINETSDLHVGQWWTVFIRLIPVVFLVLFSWWIYQSVRDNPKTWWNPLETYSTGTMVVQWGLVLLLVLALNKFFSERVKDGPMTRRHDDLEQS